MKWLIKKYHLEILWVIIILVELIELGIITLRLPLFFPSLASDESLVKLALGFVGFLFGITIVGLVYVGKLNLKIIRK